MTATTAAPPLVIPKSTPRGRSKAWGAVEDAMYIARRDIRGMTRTPQVLVFSTIQPVIFVLMFRYVFGGSINIPGIRYVDYLMAGVFVQTVVFGSMNTGVGLAEDLQKGLIERFRSLPMARSAVLAGRTLADALRNLFVIILMVVVGFMVGFHVHTNVFGLAGGILLLLFFGFAISWIMTLIGLGTRNAEAAQAAAFPIVAPLVFASNAFVSTKRMPGVLRAFANHQPVSATVDAVRALVLGGPTLGKVIGAIVWCAAIVLVFAPFAVQRYRQAA